MQQYSEIDFACTQLNQWKQKFTVHNHQTNGIIIIIS